MSDVRPGGPLLFRLMIGNYLSMNKFMAYEFRIFCSVLVVVMQQAICDYHLDPPGEMLLSFRQINKIKILAFHNTYSRDLRGCPELSTFSLMG